MTEPRNHGTTEGQGESSIAPLFQSGAIKKQFRRKTEQSQWTVKYRSRALGQGECLKGMSRIIIIQGFTLAAITDVEKTTLRRKC